MEVSTKEAIWFEGKMKYNKLEEDGVTRATTESCMIDACSFTEGEAKMCEDYKDVAECEVVSLARAKYREYLKDEDDEGGVFFKVKVNLVILDEKSGKEKKQGILYMVEASNIDKAKAIVEEVFKRSMLTYVLASISETKITNVII